MRPAGVSGRYQRMQLNDLKLISASNIIRLRQGAGLTQAELGARLNLRHTPQLQFVPDDSIAYGAHIFDLLSKLDIPEDKHDDNAD